MAYDYRGVARLLVKMGWNRPSCLVLELTVSGGFDRVDFYVATLGLAVAVSLLWGVMSSLRRVFLAWAF